MDGLRPLRRRSAERGDARSPLVLGAAFAGRPFEGGVGSGQCVRIMTGAVVPEGADTVLMQERVESLGKGTIRIVPGRAGDNIRPAGEDLALGQVALRTGRRLTPADLGLLASLGPHSHNLSRSTREPEALGCSLLPWCSDFVSRSETGVRLAGLRSAPPLCASPSCGLSPNVAHCP